jgi:hypothetical protein
MGWSYSWIAVRGKTPDAILQALGLRRPGFFERRDPSWKCADLSNGWFVVFAARSSEPAEFTDRLFGELSQQGELVVSQVEEHAMCSSSAYWKDGERIWSVAYDEQEGSDSLTASGRLPPSYRAPESADQDEDEDGEGGTDLFSIPLELGAEITGFRYDDAGELKPLVTVSGIQRKP